MNILSYMKKPNPLLDKLRSRMDSDVVPEVVASSLATKVVPIPPMKPKESIGAGKAVPVAFSITAEDQSVIKSLRAWLFSQDIEATASQIVRACIASAIRDQSFVTIVQAIRSTDGRRKHDVNL